MEIKEKQAGAELCQAQVKLGYPARSLKLPFKLSLSLKIGTNSTLKNLKLPYNIT
jgi:hypothetical protein